MEKKPEPEAAKPKPEKAKGKSKEAEKAAPKPAKPEYPRAVYFKPMFWAIKTTDMRRGHNYYQPVITVADAKAYSAVCTRLPSANDVLNLAMSRARPEAGAADARQLAAAGQWATAQLNGKLGGGAIQRVDFLRDGDPNFKGRASPCR